MMLVDAHCHLESDDYADRLDVVLDEARAGGVECFLTNSWSPEIWARSKELANEYADIRFAWGIHPWYVRPEHLALLDELRQARAHGAVAIGEIGLDRKSEATPWELQVDLFERQLRIAYDLSLPVNMHCRGAFQDLLGILKRMGPLPAGGIIHSFAGSVEIAQELVRYGVSLSLGGILTRRNSAKREKMLRWIYPDHFLLETDSPDIPPIQWIGKGPNVPVNILFNLEAAADILGVSHDDVARATTVNANRIFGLGLKLP